MASAAASLRISLVCALIAVILPLAASVTQTQTATPTNTPSSTPRPTTLATTRFTIDTFNYTFNLHSDQPQVSVGAVDSFNDGFGTARSTAVMFQTPIGNGQSYTPTRCDVLLHKVGGQSRDLITDLFLTLYSDDDTAEHNPAMQVSQSLLGFPFTRRAYYFIMLLRAMHSRITLHTFFCRSRRPSRFLHRLSLFSRTAESGTKSL